MAPESMCCTLFEIEEMPGAALVLMVVILMVVIAAMGIALATALMQDVAIRSPQGATGSNPFEALTNRNCWTC